MADIESYIKQPIPKVPVEGFAPEPGERAEPIAMGRQTIWGGLGKPPGREVMMAAAKNARAEMNQRIRESRAAGGHTGRPAGGAGEGGNGANRSHGGGRGQGGGRGGSGGGANRGMGGGGAGRPSGPRGAGANQGRGMGHAMPRQDSYAYPNEADGADDSQDRMPREGAHLGTQAGRHFREPVRGQGAAQGQPDPLRTSIDSMAGAGRRGGGGGRGRGGSGGGYGGGGGGGAGRPSGPRGPGPRSYGR